MSLSACAFNAAVRAEGWPSAVVANMIATRKKLADSLDMVVVLRQFTEISSAKTTIPKLTPTSGSANQLFCMCYLSLLTSSNTQTPLP